MHTCLEGGPSQGRLRDADALLEHIHPTADMHVVHDNERCDSVEGMKRAPSVSRQGPTLIGPLWEYHVERLIQARSLQRRMKESGPACHSACQAQP